MAEDDHYAVTAPAGDGRVLLGSDVEIFPAKPLNAYASFETRAFEARDIKTGKPLMALTAGRSRCPRISAIGSYQNIKAPNLLKLVSAGII